MAGPLEISDAPRAIGPECGVADIPLVTLAWRSMRAECQRRLRDTEELAGALAGCARGVVRLQRAVHAFATGSDAPADRRTVLALAAVAEGLEQSLRRAGVRIVAPKEGEPYTTELMELVESVSQLPGPEVHEPRIAELIEPAILYGGALLQMGKAVILVPVRTAAG